MLLTFKLLFAACTYYVTIMIYEQKNETKQNQKTKTKQSHMNPRQRQG